ncbi:hypothetical protein TSUD_159290 [Trifolium subterraneum]|uniref:Uncharacterized protein n=1 Tax=Trifolium subterraneum TaxID=3900 RepID=A0A2Z6MAH8_TRISU|nr:hypothetical protein TSUD_159290 [Trifolium subterraneum]
MKNDQRSLTIGRKLGWAGMVGTTRMQQAVLSVTRTRALEVNERKGGVNVNVRTGLNEQERMGTVANVVGKGAGLEEVVRVGEVVVRSGERKAAVDNTGVPVVEDELNLGIKVQCPIEREVSGTSLYVRKYMDMFVEKFANGMEEDDGPAFQKFVEEHTHNQSTYSVNKDEPVKEVAPDQKLPSSEEDPPLDVAVTG